MMKKIFLLLCLALVTLVANAGSPYDTKEKLINRAKAIVAYHALSKKGCKGNFKKDDDTINAKNVDDLQKLIKNDPDKRFATICKEIKEYDVDDKDSISLIKSFKALLKQYNVNDNGALNEVKVPIIRSPHLFNEDSEDDDLDENDENPDGHRSEGYFNKGDKETFQDRIEEKSKSDIVTPILPIVILILLLILLGLFCFQLFKENNKLKTENSYTRDVLSEIVKPRNPNYANKKLKLKELVGIVQTIYNEVLKDKESLKNENKQLNEINKELKARVENAERKSSAYNNSFSTNRGNDYGNVSSNVVRGEESNSTTLTWDIDNSERSIHESESPKASLVGKEMFLYLPNDNMFKEGSEEYRSGKTLYKMVYTSEESADFEFINRPEALAFAKQSRSRFLEGACFIENDDAISFNTIQTLEKGKLAKADEGWNIISKARIRLS